MKKEMIRRGLHGIPQGIAIGYVISIIISLIEGSGTYQAVVPDLATQLNSEILAIVVQMIFTAVVGGGFAAASVIWEIDEWSILKQTGVYFCVISLMLLPISYFLHWMERSVGGFIIYFGIFIVLFLVIWIIQYLFWKKRINKINDKL